MPGRARKIRTFRRRCAPSILISPTRGASGREKLAVGRAASTCGLPGSGACVRRSPYGAVENIAPRRVAASSVPAEVAVIPTPATTIRNLNLR
jgi:hypothetical protein